MPSEGITSLVYKLTNVAFEAAHAEGLKPWVRVARDELLAAIDKLEQRVAELARQLAQEEAASKLWQEKTLEGLVQEECKPMQTMAQEFYELKARVAKLEQEMSLRLPG
jgi:acyl carrier protein phosphodiesterase